MNLRIRIRILCIFMIILSSFIGIASRRFAVILPDFIADYAGDTVWAFAAYYLIRFFIPSIKIKLNAIIAYIFSIMIELSQLIHYHWLNRVRSSFVGGLMLGFGFVWTDLICYAAGIIVAVLTDRYIISRNYLFD